MVTPIENRVDKAEWFLQDYPAGMAVQELRLILVKVEVSLTNSTAKLIASISIDTDIFST